MKTIFQQSRTQQRECGLTLVEMMVATSLLVVMMLGLTAMFNQTQRAFRSGLKQVDVFEGGRAVMDMIARDIEQLTASMSMDHISVYSGLQATNSLDQSFPIGASRANVLHKTFLLNYSSQWVALGYRVLNASDIDAYDPLPYGTLYRFSTNFTDLPTQPNYYYNLLATNLPSRLTNGYLTRVADGVVHFRLRFYDNAGKPIPYYDDDTGEPIIPTNPPPPLVVATGLPNEAHVAFYNNALPSMVEVELGILEPQTLKQAESLPNTGPVPTPRADYLERQAGKVHVFRQQIPIRNAPR